MTEFTYDLDGKLLTEKVDGTTLATVTYTTTGLTSRIDYSNGTALSSITRDPAMRTTGQTFAFPGGKSFSDQQVLSQTGRVVTDTTSDNGGTGQVSDYTYDAVGRLVQATIPGHVLSYGFGTASCGANPAAGKNGNRTTSSDAHTVSGSTNNTAVAYCYDSADRLTGTTVTGAPTGASPLLASNLSTIAPGATLVYDGHGNTTTIANQTISYDSADRHTATIEKDAQGATTSTVTYTRDASNRIVLASTVKSGTTTTVYYSYTGDGDTPDFSITNTNAIEHTLPLPGGVLASIKSSSQVWSYPNLHGDVVANADVAGVRLGTLASYDPFGNPIDPTTGNIGTVLADHSVPNNTDSQASYGWEGSHQRLFQHAGDTGVIEMGARQYIPLLGRFLSVDSVQGGSDNDYVYATDPLNSSDLSGRSVDWGTVIGVAAIVAGIAAAAVCAASVVCGIVAGVAIGAAAGVATYAATTNPKNYTVPGFISAGAVGAVSGAVPLGGGVALRGAIGSASRYAAAYAAETVVVKGASRPAVTTFGVLLARNRFTGQSSRLFARGTGKLNKGSVRIGWNWMGTRNNGTNTFRLAWGARGTHHRDFGSYR